MIHKQGLYSNPRNFAGIPAPLSDYEFARAVVLPVPYDSTTEWHNGARKGPASIIEASYYLEWYDLELQRETHLSGIHTMPGLEPAFSSPENMIQKVYTAARSILEDSKFLVTLGGEHSISLGCIHAYVDKYPGLSVLQLDAHSDLRDEYLGTKYGHACVMRRAVDLCPITQVGIRAMSLEEREFSLSRGLSPYFFERGSLTLPIEEILGSLRDDVYVTIDLDVFDPSIMSAVGTPEPGGINWLQALDLLKAVSDKRRIVGFDIVELSPDQGPAACSFLAAKLAYKLIGYSTPQA
jgi:agmatinase